MNAKQSLVPQSHLEVMPEMSQTKRKEALERRANTEEKEDDALLPTLPSLSLSRISFSAPEVVPEAATVDGLL